MSEPTCLPPPSTASGTAHVLRGPDNVHVALVWDEACQWWSAIGETCEPEILAGDGYSHVGPLTPPEEVERLRHALRVIAGLEQCADNLLSHPEIARAALESPHAE